MSAGVAAKHIIVEAQVAKLHPSMTPRAYADVCREAGLAFMAGAQGSWGKRELAEWLVGAYGSVSARMATLGGTSATSPIPVDDRAVGELVDLVRVAVSSALADLTRGETGAVSDALREQTVTAGHDTRGLIWIPVDRPRMRLEARVLSLFVADYLMRPEAYEQDLSVCGACDAVSFDGAGRACASCGDRERPSHVRSLSPDRGLIAAPLPGNPIKDVG